MTAGWQLELTPRARRDLRNLDRPVRARVLGALGRLTDDPPIGELTSLVGTNDHRLRVGDWRVRVRLDRHAQVVVVLRVLPRGRAYNR